MTILLLCLSLYSIYLYVDCVPCMYVIMYYVCMFAVYVRPSLAHFSDDLFRNSNVIDTFFYTLESECESQSELRTTGQRIGVFRYWF